MNNNSSYRTNVRQQNFHSLVILTGWPPSEGKHNGRIDLEVSVSAGVTPPTGSQPASQRFWVMNPENLTDSGHYSWSWVVSTQKTAAKEVADQDG